MNGWQPIETAPKDKGCLIGWVEGTVRFIQWGKTSHVPMYGWNLADQGVEEFDLCHPTHWMPLPAAPGATPNEKASMGEGERAEFEAWADAFHFDLTRSPPEYMNKPYANEFTDWCWLAWQAASARALLAKHKSGEKTE